MLVFPQIKHSDNHYYVHVHLNIDFCNVRTFFLYEITKVIVSFLSLSNSSNNSYEKISKLGHYFHIVCYKRLINNQSLSWCVSQAFFMIYHHVCFTFLNLLTNFFLNEIMFSLQNIFILRSMQFWEFYCYLSFTELCNVCRFSTTA